MTNLLHKAYGDINAGNVQSAQDVLERLVQADPLNIEAWEAYMQVCETCEELDSLCERILQVSGINEVNRESILDYYYFLRRNFKSCDLKFEPQRNVTLELINQFSFSLIDQSMAPGKLDASSVFHKSFIRLLGKVMFVPYIILLLAGLSLIFTANSFGYWMLVFLVLGFFISSRTLKPPFAEANKEQSSSPSFFSNNRSDQIQYRSEVIH